jgi:hypothetical protein
MAYRRIWYSMQAANIALQGSMRSSLAAALAS